MPELPPLDDLCDLEPADVLVAIRQYVERNQAKTFVWDLFEGGPDTEQVPFLELTEIPVDQIDPDDDQPRSDQVLLLLPAEDEDPFEFGEHVARELRAGQCTLAGLGNGRFMVHGDGRMELALLTMGRGVWHRPEDYLDHRAGLELRDADGPPVSMRILGDADRPLPGRSPENQLDLLCEAIETRGGPTDQTRVLLDVVPWSTNGAYVSLSPELIERLARSRVGISITALPFRGRRKALQAGHDGDELVIPLPEDVMFYETLRRESRWLRSRGRSPEWLHGSWMWLVETDLGWFCIDGDEEPRAMGFGGPLL